MQWEGLSYQPKEVSSTSMLTSCLNVRILMFGYERAYTNSNAWVMSRFFRIEIFGFHSFGSIAEKLFSFWPWIWFASKGYYGNMTRQNWTWKDLFETLWKYVGDIAINKIIETKFEMSERNYRVCFFEMSEKLQGWFFKVSKLKR